MKLHPFHFTPHGIVRACTHLAAGCRLCREIGVKMRGVKMKHVNCMTPAYNVHRTLSDLNLPHPKTIIDIGANISQITQLLCAPNEPVKVISFELNLEVFSKVGKIKRIAICCFKDHRNFTA